MSLFFLWWMLLCYCDEYKAIVDKGYDLKMAGWHKENDDILCE